MVDAELPSWSSIADWYDHLLTSGSGPHETALECLAELLPHVDGRRVVDIACGQGIVSRYLAECGAFVVGVDSSAAMIQNATAHGSPASQPIQYMVDDAESLSDLETDSFDAATCQLALMDIGDLDAALHSVARVLRPGATLTFLIGHPCILAPGAQHTVTSAGEPAVVITDYFNERFWRSKNPEGVRRAGNYHRTLSTYLNALAAAGFIIEESREPAANELLARQQPLYSKVPMFFAARVRS